MLRISKESQQIGENEDVFIARRVKTLPPNAIAHRFAAEMSFSPDPAGIHQIYKFFDWRQIVSLMKTVPGLPLGDYPNQLEEIIEKSKARKD